MNTEEILLYIHNRINCLAVDELTLSNEMTLSSPSDYKALRKKHVCNAAVREELQALSDYIMEGMY